MKSNYWHLYHFKKLNNNFKISKFVFNLPLLFGKNGQNVKSFATFTHEICSHCTTCQIGKALLSSEVCKISHTKNFHFLSTNQNISSYGDCIKCSLRQKKHPEYRFQNIYEWECRFGDEKRHMYCKTISILSIIQQCSTTSLHHVFFTLSFINQPIICTNFENFYFLPEAGKYESSFSKAFLAFFYMAKLQFLPHMVVTCW